MIGYDIQKQIEVHNMRRNMYVTEKEYLLKKMMQGPTDIKPVNLSGMPHGSSDDTSLDRQVDHLRKLQNMIELEDWAMESLEEQVKLMQEKIKELKGIDARVKYLRDFEGKALKEIADALGYELGYIKQVSARNPRKI